jgi:outer membrane protein TolC
MRQFEKNIIETREEVRNSDELINARKVAAISAINSMRAVREQFAFNKGTLLDLMTAQESLYNAGKEFVDAEANRQIIRYRFLHLTTGLDKIFDLSDAAPIVAQ